MPVSVMRVETFPPPPPPLPPPPPPPVTPLTLTPRPTTDDGVDDGFSGTVPPSVTSAVSFHSLGYEAYEQLQRTNSCFTDLTKYCYVSFHQHVHPILQNGPECGIVALAMAGPLLGKPCLKTEHILNRGRELNLSKQGEIFSVDYMRTLAEDVLQCSAAVCRVGAGWDRQPLVASLLQRAVMLVPYDSDKNHRPCLKKGHKAHWAVISGFFLVISKEVERTVHSLCSPDSHRAGLYHCSTPSSLLPLQYALQHVTVYTQQGKSRHPGVWPLDDLLASNTNLTELDPSRAAEEDAYVIPPGGVLEGLCGRIVILTKD